MTRAFRLYAVLLALSTATVLYFVAGWTVEPGVANAHWNALAALVVLGFVSEASFLRLRVGSTETQSSISFIPFIASFLLLDTGWAAVVGGASMFGVEFAVKRKPPFRILFNVSQMTLSVALAAMTYRALGGNYSLVNFSLAPTALLISVLIFFFVNSAAVTAAIVFDLRQRVWAAWRRIAGVSLFYDLFSSSLAVALAYLYIRLQVLGIILLILPIYFVRHLYQVSLQLEQVNRDLLELMVKAIEARDPYTSGHSQRVSELAAALARQHGLSSKLVEQVEKAALLHDVGKIHEEYAPLLRKGTKLDPTEKALMQTHSLRSADLVGTISAFRGGITEAVRHHHENYDGSGYPGGLAGEAIPIGARIIMIADTVDAMTTDRPYRKALSFARVTQELNKYSGRQFDPQLVATFMQSAILRSIVVKRVPADDTAVEDSTSSTGGLPWRRSAAKPVAATVSALGVSKSS